MEEKNIPEQEAVSPEETVPVSEPEAAEVPVIEALTFRSEDSVPEPSAAEENVPIESEEPTAEFPADSPSGDESLAEAPDSADMPVEAPDESPAAPSEEVPVAAESEAPAQEEKMEAPAVDDYPEGDPFADGQVSEPTRRINLSDLKFGRNYTGEQD